MKYTSYILIIRDNVMRDNEIAHISGHATREDAERKAEMIGRKAKHNLKAQIYVDPRPRGNPSTWELIASIAL